jgi:hypothetical protein
MLRAIVTVTLASTAVASSSVRAQTDPQPVRLFLPVAFSRGGNRDTLPAAGTPLTGAALGTPVPVAGATRFFDDQVFDANGELSIWIPPNAPVVRGILFMNISPVRPNPADPDWRNQVAQARELAARQLASAWGFAYLSGTTSQDGLSGFDAQAAHLDKSLVEFAAKTGHPELTKIPLVIHGMSRTGAFGCRYAQRNPQRVIAYVVIVADNCGVAPGVPGLIIVGEQDRGANVVSGGFARDRAQGALIAVAMMWGVDHKCDKCGDLAWPFMDRMVRKRLLMSEPPAIEMPALAPLSETDGWLGDVTAWGGIASYGAYAGDKRAAAWLPDQTLAQVWAGMVQKSHPLRLSAPSTPYAWANGFTQQPAPHYGKTLRDATAARPFTVTAAASTAFGAPAHLHIDGVDYGPMQPSADGKSFAMTGIALAPGVHAFVIRGADGAALSLPAGWVVTP